MAQFQIRKITAGLQQLQAQGQRLPDELVIMTQGRKDIFLHTLFATILGVFGKRIVYLDDSKSQLESVAARMGEQVACFWAAKIGAARAALVGDASTQTAFPVVALDQTSLSEFVQSLLVD